MDKVQIVSHIEGDSNHNNGYGAMEHVLTDNSMSNVDLSSYISPHNNCYPKDPDFEKKVYQVELAIDLGVLPKLSEKGTSGCYFVKSLEGVS